jgi:hypothetical protein
MRQILHVRRQTCRVDAWPAISTMGTGGAALAFLSVRRWLWRLSLARRLVVFVVLVLMPGLAAAALIAGADPLHLRHNGPAVVCHHATSAAMINCS